MTTYKYTVPWLEVQTSFAQALRKREWTEVCSALQTQIPEVELPATNVTDEFVLSAGALADARKGEQAKLYAALRGSRTAVRGRVKKGLVATAKMIVAEKEVFPDLKAVHGAYLGLCDWAEEHTSHHASTRAKWAATVAASTAHGHVINCRLDHRTSGIKAGLIRDALYKALIKPLQILDAIRLVKRRRHASSTRKKVLAYGCAATPEEERRARKGVAYFSRAEMPPNFPKMEFWGPRVFMRVRGKAYILSTGDLQRLEQYACGVLNMQAALVFEATRRLKDPTSSLAWVERQAQAQSEACLAVPVGQEVHVCRAYMQAYKTALAAHAGKKAAVDDAEAELKAMPFVAKTTAWSTYRTLAQMSVHQIVNLGITHKILPPAACLGAATAYARFQKARKENPRREVAEGRPAYRDDLVAACLRDEVTRALRAKDPDVALTLKNPRDPPAWYPAWRDRKVVPNHVGWSEALDLRGNARAPIRSDYSAAVFKDSALAPDVPPYDERDMRPKSETNMALRRFMSPAYPTQAAAKESLKVKRKRYAKADQKPENYKDPLRLFYEATLIDRMGVSWTEEAIYSVAKYHPCYMLGKGPQETQKRARSMISPADPGRVKRHFSFDVSNWSAGMSKRIQEVSGKLWAEVFDDEAVGCAYNTMANATVYVQKHGVYSGYDSPTANFEGYDGKAMTMVHIALMSATIARVRQVTGNDDISAELMAYIDDGAATLSLPTADGDAIFAEFMECAEEVYGYERFVLHSLKCMPSDRMFLFLNEVYYAGAHEVSSTKACIRVAAEPKDLHESLVDRVMTISSGTQGAVQAGLTGYVAALFCYFLVALELFDWAPDERWLMSTSEVAVGLFIASPAAYYGLAVPSPVGFDKTGKGASLSEGIAAMQSFAQVYPDVRPAVIARLRTPLPKRSKLAILRNPTGTAGLSVLRTNRIALALSAAAPRLATNPVAKKVMAPLQDSDAEAYAAAMLSGSRTLSATAIQLMWKASPFANAEAWLAKFESSKTIAELIGREALNAIAREHRSDALRAMAIAFGKAHSNV